MIELPDHARARLAYEHVCRVRDAGDERRRDKYKSICLKLPVLVHTAGLAPALHFVAARGDIAQREILGDLAGQLALVDANALLVATRKTDLVENARLTREVQRCLQWYKRFAQSELPDAEVD